MNKSNTLFEIDKYDLKEDKIIVEIFRKGKEETVTIPRAEYEKWLADSGRLEWVSDVANYCGEHEQTTGTLPIDIYWEELQNGDLYDWIVLKWIAEDVFDIQTPLGKILGGHFYDSLKTISESENVLP